MGCNLSFQAKFFPSSNIENMSKHWSKTSQYLPIISLSKFKGQQKDAHNYKVGLYTEEEGLRYQYNIINFLKVVQAYPFSNLGGSFVTKKNYPKMCVL